MSNSIKVVEDIDTYIYEYHTDPQNQTLDVSKHRFASYDFCHSYFLRNRDSLSSKMEESCIYLWSFLGSWGMLRGSSVLFKENSPASLCNVVECIAKRSLGHRRRTIWKRKVQATNYRAVRLYQASLNRW